MIEKTSVVLLVIWAMGFFTFHFVRLMLDRMIFRNLPEGFFCRFGLSATEGPDRIA